MKKIMYLIVLLLTINAVVGLTPQESEYLADHTIVYYKFAETEFNFTDSTSNNINLAYGTSGSRVPYLINYGHDFENDNQEFMYSVNDNSLLDISSFSWWCWITPENLTSTGNYLINHQRHPIYAGGDVCLGWKSYIFNHKIGMEVFGDSDCNLRKDVWASNTTYISEGVTYFIMGTFNEESNGDIKMYIDNVLDGSLTVNSTAIVNFTHTGVHNYQADRMEVGNIYWADVWLSTYSFDGIMGECGYTNIALNSTYRDFLWNSGTPTSIQQFPYNVTTKECNDGIDNDGDGFIDYPADPSCSSLLDDSEAPYDSMQCSDGIDNDGDGWIDMADPHCSVESDNSELPYDNVFTGDDDCFVAAGCLLYDSVPYSNDLALHGWYGILEQTRINGYQGGYSIFIDGYDNATATLSTVYLAKDITNSNVYGNVTMEVIVSFLDKTSILSSFSNQSFGISFLNENNSQVIETLLNISTTTSGIYDLVAEIYVVNGSTINYVGQAFMENSVDFGLLRFNFWIDQINGLFNFNYTDSVGLTQSGDYLVSNVSKIHTINFQSNLNSQEIWAYMNVIEIIGEGNFTTECNDGIDNDGDWFADYPSDPSCSSLGDDSESPFDYTECNDGIDNDLDGFIDLADPRCNHPTDPTEFPSDYSQQSETECLAEESCLFYEQFPYTDSINLHGWEGNIAVFVVEPVFGSNKLDLDNLGYIGFDTFHNITNENIYSNVRVQFDTFVNKLASSTEYFYIIIEDYFGKDILKLKYELVPSQTVNIYYWNTTAYELIVEGTLGNDEDSKLQMVMDFDQVLKTWDFSVNYATGSSSSPDDFAEWSDVLANKVHKIRFVNGNFNSANWDFWIDNILISGIDTEEVSGACDTWNLPYYLVESFRGYLSNCDWVTTHNIWTTGNLSVTEDINFYSAHKRTDLAEEDNTRYVTMTFDLDIVNIAVIGSTITFRLYDSDDFNFVTIFFRDSGDYLWYNDGGSGEIAGMITLNQSFPYKFVIDFIDDEWDIYYNGTSLVNNSDFTNSFANIESLQTFKVTSSDATFNLDNLKIYGSDATGTPLLPDDELTKIVVNDSIWCGMFYKTNPKCVADEDCTTGDCLPGGTCNRFNMAYCDDEGYTRGNYCMLAGVSSCVLSSTADLVLDHFFLFVILIMLMMGLVYLIIMFRRGS